MFMEGGSTFMTRRNNFSQCIGYLINTLDCAADSWQKTGMIYFNISAKQYEELLHLRDAIEETLSLPGNILINNEDDNI